MKISKNWSAVILLLLVLMMSIGYANRTREDNTHLTSEEKKIIRDQYGAVIQDSQGRRMNYTREQILEQQEQSLQVPQSLPSFISDNAKATAPSESFWSYATSGCYISDSGIITDPLGKNPEMYIRMNIYWYALHYNAAIGQYEQNYVSPYFPSNIISIKAADVIGNKGYEILVVLESGHIRIYDQATKKQLKEVETAARNLTDMEISDLDNDGEKEIILCTSYHLYVYSPSGILEWDVNAGGYDALVGQMDNDSSLEIAVTGGQVIDCASRTIQWNWPKGFGRELKAADIDSDQKEELIVSEDCYTIWAYDVDRQLPKWSIPIELDIGAIYLEDIDKDSVIELLVGDGQWGEITAYDTVTLAKEWSIKNPEHGVSNIIIGDSDGDGFSELIWGAGANTSGGDFMYIANWQTGLIEWQSISLYGPFLGPVIGDVDGDGKNEIVAINSFYHNSCILVFDSHHHLRATSDPIVDGETYDIALFDVDRDGRQEILVAAEHFHDGVIEVYDFNPDNTFTLNWTYSTWPTSASFYAVAAGDIDGDSQMEILGGVVSIYVYNYKTGREEWHSQNLGYAIREIEINDLDKDGTQEIIGLAQDVYIFNGVTKELEAIIQGNNRVLTLLNLDPNTPALALGNSDGDISIYTYSNGNYQMIFNRKYGTGAIDGISSKSTTVKQLFGSKGTLNIATANGTVWRSACYGNVFGIDFAYRDDISAIYTGGSHSINGFILDFTAQPELTLNRSQLYFSVNTAGVGSREQKVRIDNSGGGTLNWTAETDTSWLNVTPTSGSGPGIITASVNAAGQPVGDYTGRVTVSDPNALNSPQSVPVSLKVHPVGNTQNPFGDFSTPLDGTTVSGSFPVTGWALDDIEVMKVEIFSGETYVGDAVFVDGARPDIEQAYPGYPENYRAGWGYMLLSHFLPGGGNGTYTLVARATDAEGHQVTLGSKTITVDNTNAVKPFGAIDTPGQGGTAAGNNFINHGWVLTPKPSRIPISGETIDVYVDGVNLGHPVYNIYRSDVAALFPGYANSGGAGGSFTINTTAYANGLHSIYWVATDEAGHSDGIGSRFFTIENIGGTNTLAVPSTYTPKKYTPKELESIPVKNTEPVQIRRGFGRDGTTQEIFPDSRGITGINLEELEPIEIHLGENMAGLRGYMEVKGQMRDLPIGSTLDIRTGKFCWIPGPGYIGTYKMVFIIEETGGKCYQRKVDITIEPKFDLISRVPR